MFIIFPSRYNVDIYLNCIYAMISLAAWSAFERTFAQENPLRTKICAQFIGLFGNHTQIAQYCE